jgi:hypothetical protein
MTIFFSDEAAKLFPRIFTGKKQNTHLLILRWRPWPAQSAWIPLSGVCGGLLG